MAELIGVWTVLKKDENNISLRRRLLMSVPLVALPLVACSQGNAKNQVTTDAAGLSAEDAELKYRFRNISSGELITDGLIEMNRVALHNELGALIRSGTFSLKNRGTSNYGGNFVVPKTVRMMWFSDESITKGASALPPAYEGGTIRADVTVPVATRFPTEVLDEARTKGAGLRLKLRVHPEGVLVGWDIERRPGYDPKKLDTYGAPVYVAPVFSFVGGDFNQAKVYNGQVIEKGWYIHPKTGQKIETDF